MGFLDLFRPSASPVARVSFQFPDDFETSSRVSIVADSALPNGFETWIWDLYYAKTLFNLGRCDIADGMKAQMEAWAEKWATVSLSELPLPSEALVLDPDLALSFEPMTRAETYSMEILARGDRWPTIQTRLPSNGFQNRGAYSVVAFAQYLFGRDRQYFARELPVHVLAMRKYYSDVKPYTKIGSVLGAPVQAMNSALKLFENLNRSVD